MANNNMSAVERGVIPRFLILTDICWCLNNLRILVIKNKGHLCADRNSLVILFSNE